MTRSAGEGPHAAPWAGQPVIKTTTPRLVLPPPGQPQDLFTRVSQRQKQALHLPSLKSARTKALADALNLSPRVCDPARCGFYLKNNPGLLLASATEGRRGKLHYMLPSDGALSARARTKPPTSPRVAAEEAPREPTRDAPEVAPTGESEPSAHAEEAPAAAPVDEEGAAAEEGSASVAGGSDAGMTPRARPRRRASRSDMARDALEATSNLAELQTLISEHQKLTHALRRAAVRRTTRESGAAS